MRQEWPGLRRFKDFIKTNKLEVLFVLAIIILAAFLRFYRINELNFFTYDQARDALYIKRIIVDHKFRLIGTQTSIPGLYTGPGYYYLMAPFLWIFRLNPVGIDIGIAIFGILTVVGVYFLVRKCTRNRLVALATASWYATQPEIVNQSRFAWNPNPMPFFFLTFLLGLFRLLERKQDGWLLSFLSLAILLQLHYSAICLIPVLIIFLFLHRKVLVFGKLFSISFILFMFSILPILLFEIKHNFINSKAILIYIQRGTQGKIPPPPFLIGLVEKLRFLVVELPFSINSLFFSRIILLFIFILGLMYFLKKRSSNIEFILISLCIGFGVLTASLYRGSFFNFYLTMLYPAGFLLVGILLAYLCSLRAKAKIGLVFLWILILVFNLKDVKGYLKTGRTISDLKVVASVIAQDVKENEPFNLVGILGGERFDYNAVDYRYFLESYYNKRVPGWDVADYKDAKVLYLINTLGDVDPLKLSIWELKIFGPKNVLRVWKLPKNVVIYKLGK